MTEIINFCNLSFKITIWGVAWNPSLIRKALIIRWFSTDGLVHCLIFIIWDNPPSAYLDHPPVNINILSALYISDCQSIQTPGADLSIFKCSVSFAQSLDKTTEIKAENVTIFVFKDFWLASGDIWEMQAVVLCKYDFWKELNSSWFFFPLPVAEAQLSRKFISWGCTCTGN